MAKQTRNRRDSRYFNDNFWQSAAYNQRVYAKNIDICLALAVNRFRWAGMPETCDARYFEMQIHRFGFATIARDPDTDAWLSIMATLNGELNVYGIPIEWRAIGQNGRADFPVRAGENGELCYYSKTRVNPWNALEIYARKLTHYERTEDVNLTHQMKPWVFIAPQEKKQELYNLLKQVEGGEPAVLGDGKFADIVSSITAIDTKVPFIAEQLALSKQNVFNDLLMYLGIPHLAFEKGERMIEDEARANSAPTDIMLKNCLDERNRFCDAMRAISSDFADMHVVFNDDYESYNWNYTHNLEQMAQDGALSLAAPDLDVEGMEGGETE